MLCFSWREPIQVQYIKFWGVGCYFSWSYNSFNFSCSANYYKNRLKMFRETGAWLNTMSNFRFGLKPDVIFLSQSNLFSWLLSPGSTKPNIFPIVYDRHNRVIANNLKPIGTVKLFLSKKKSVSSIYNVLFWTIYIFLGNFSFCLIKSSSTLLHSQSVHNMFRNGHDDPSYNWKHIRKYSDQ